MEFRNIVLPYGQDSANPIEDQSSNAIPERGKFTEIEVGAGGKTFKMDERGLWLGSEDFETAPFSVDMNGNIRILAADGSGGYLLINAALTQILINDGTNDRILIGKQIGGF